MTAEVDCPVCEGGGEVGDRQDYFGNWDTKPCGACRGTGAVPADEVDREGFLITFDGCYCSLWHPCADAACQMDRELAASA